MHRFNNDRPCDQRYYRRIILKVTVVIRVIGHIRPAGRCTRRQRLVGDTALVKISLGNDIAGIGRAHSQTHTAGQIVINNDTSGARYVLALDSHGHDFTDEYFSFEHGELRTQREIIPSMLTLDERVISQDCLCYLMEVIDPFPQHAEQA
ncbi:MAG: hypothetical protein PF630_12820 [Gammaproteobacteria bacterium]|nr:hypothetical protein [Gammaproteobacteria bacterium]